MVLTKDTHIQTYQHKLTDKTKIQNKTTLNTNPRTNTLTASITPKTNTSNSILPLMKTMTDSQTSDKYIFTVDTSTIAIDFISHVYIRSNTILDAIVRVKATNDPTYYTIRPSTQREPDLFFIIAFQINYRNRILSK